jgi:hypothetical protein
MQFECTYVPEISIITILHSATQREKLRAKKKVCFVNLKSRDGLIENKIIRRYYRPIEGYRKFNDRIFNSFGVTLSLPHT